MGSRLGRVLSAWPISVCLLLFVGVVCVAAAYVNPREHRVRVFPGFYGTVWRGRGQSRVGEVVFFTDAALGPFRGGLLGVRAGDKVVRLVDDVQCSCCGVYYRRLSVVDRSYWTVAVSLWYLIGLCCVLLGAQLLAAAKVKGRPETAGRRSVAGQ